jgi:isoleucyl-tRNA synthetase
MPAEQKTAADKSFPRLEEEALKFWEEADIFNKSLTKEAPRGDYVFYDGPPFATGTPHYGHIVASIMKDIIPRYQTMRGYHVERKWGWDCHGLPIENIVEKELGTKTKKEIETLGVDKFNALCRQRVLTYVDEWQKVIRRLGRWADMSHPYKTMDLEFMDSIWWAFKQLWDKDLIYQDYRSMYICPRCETTLAQSEVSEGYRDIKDLSATVKFHLKPGQKWWNGQYETKDSAYILAWTTTPWTLIGNVALAVGSDIKYTALRIKGAPELLIVASDRIKDLFADKELEIVHDHIEGSYLVGLEYEPPFRYYYNDQSLANRANGWKIYAADFVTTTEGTGVVHIAPAFGEDDMNLGRAKSLPFIQHVGMDGVFKPEVTDFAGLHVKPLGDHTTTDVEIIKYLAAHGTLFSKAKYEHSYPHCWRCDTPLINYATSSWFIAVTKIKEQLLKNATSINWSPEYIKEGRFGNWLEGARDWSISRQRFWASAIPIWECSCGARRVIGSVAELEQLTGQKITDIHKDKVDILTFKCEKCGGTMKRVSDVLDCWFESGSMPFAQLHYPTENKDKFEKNFPAQFIAEGVDQTRTWFYYLHVVAGGIFSRPAFQNVIANGIVLAEDGKKMSKRLQNYPDPLLVMEKYGSDALRAYLAAAPVMAAENLNFSEKGVQESLRKNVMILWNVYKFYEMFAPELQATKGVKSQNVLDQWILAKLDLLIKEVSDALEAYNLPKAMRPLTEFIDELSTWYLRRSRDRFKAENEQDKQEALFTTRLVLLQLSKLLAPFMPFLAENLWQRASGLNFTDPNRSVHLEVWPQFTVPAKSVFKKIFTKKYGRNHQALIDQMAVARHLVEIGLAKRDAAGIKIRQKLNRLTVTGKVNLPSEYLPLITDELNINEVIFIPTDDEKLSAELDTEITPALKQEGLKRELIRSLNLWRKDNNLQINDRVAVVYEAPEELRALIEAVKADIIKDTLLTDLTAGPVVGANAKEVKIDGQIVKFGLAAN